MFSKMFACGIIPCDVGNSGCIACDSGNSFGFGISKVGSSETETLHGTLPGLAGTGMPVLLDMGLCVTLRGSVRFIDHF